MTDKDLVKWRRIAILAELVARSPTKLGRTALMKFAYLLQTIRKVPLGYDFRLYNYGPFDSDVLNDLGHAQLHDVVTSEMVAYPSGYGYEFCPSSGYEQLQKRMNDDVVKYKADIDWVVAEFSSENASSLELIATVVYAAAEMPGGSKGPRQVDLERRVHEIKPHFSDTYVAETVGKLRDKKLLIVQ